MEKIIIDKANAIVRQFDIEYCNLLKKILSEGELFENRTGIDTLSIEGVNMKLNVGEEFPILESKKVNIKNALTEMLWIYQAQSNQVSWLRDRGNNIWNEWEVDEDGIYRTYEQGNDIDDPERKEKVVDLDGKEMTDKEGKTLYTSSTKEGKTIKNAKFYGKEYAGTIGTAYGWINNKFKRPQYVLQQLKNNPHDRRMIISLWQDEYLKTAVLPSCVWSSEYKVSNGKLNSYVHQRSADVPLGLPFNISQYAILLSMFASLSNLEVGNMNWSIMDAHIYVNQIEGIKTQIRRFDLMRKYEEIIKNSTQTEIENKYIELLAKRKYMIMKMSNISNVTQELDDINEEILIFELMMNKKKTELVLKEKSSFFDYNNEVSNDKDYLKENMTGNEDIKVIKYSSAPFIKMPIAQ